MDSKKEFTAATTKGFGNVVAARPGTTLIVFGRRCRGGNGTRIVAAAIVVIVAADTFVAAAVVVGVGVGTHSLATVFALFALSSFPLYSLLTTLTCGTFVHA